MAMRLLTAAVLVVGAVVVAPLPARADGPPGTCVGTPLTAVPDSGSRVSPGDRIIYHADLLVRAGTALGCARDLRVSPLLEFVSAAPGGSYWPDATDGPIAEVSFTGPFPAGTRLRGKVVMRVRADAVRGASITATSGDIVLHTVRS